MEQKPKKDKKRIGIVSMYHNSRNYGGLLQAYALCEFLNSCGYDAKQIDLPSIQTTRSNLFKKLISSPIYYLKKTPIWLVENIGKVLVNIFNKDIIKANEIRNKKIDLFRIKQIPHMDFSNDINQEFDAFVCGSDQIWNPYAFRSEYFLEFADKEKIRFSYAASIAKSDLPDADLQKIKPLIEKLDKVSVREKNSLKLLERINIENAVSVLDPTMLLDAEVWKEKAIKPDIEKQYLFYYVLEKDNKKRKLAKILAKRMNLEFVEIPMVDGKISFGDLFVKSYACATVDPFGFIGLILDARFVITDSFHATVFSVLFRKDFYALECKKTETLYPRIEALLKVFGIEKNYAKNNFLSLLKQTEFKTEYLQNDEFLNIRQQSREFLLDATD